MQLADFIVCEDVRQEVSGKMSIIGAYNDEILFSSLVPGEEVKWPLATRIAFFMRLMRDENEDYDKFEFTITHREKQIAATSGQIRYGDPRKKPIRLVIIIPQIAFEGPGQLEFKLVMRGGSGPANDVAIDRPFAVGIRSLDMPSQT